LNDKIYLDRSYWNINKVIDYDANSNDTTKVELLSIDDELILPRIVSRPDNKPNNASSLVKPFIGQVLGNINGSLTVNASSGNVVVSGKGNIIDSPITNAVVIGDNQLVTKNGITTNNSAINENFANTDLTFTDNRVHSLNGYNLSISDNAADIFQKTPSLTRIYHNYGADRQLLEVGDSVFTLESLNNVELKIISDSSVLIDTIILNVPNLPTYDSDILAGLGGLTQGMVYQTSTGVLRIKL